MKVLLVGAGGVGGAITGIAARRDFFDAMVVADYDETRARRVVQRVGDSRLSAIRIDAGRVATNCCVTCFFVNAIFEGSQLTRILTVQLAISFGLNSYSVATPGMPPTTVAI